MTAYNNYCLGLENNTPPQGGSLFVSKRHPTILLNNNGRSLGWVGGGPSNFIVNQSLNLWNLEFNNLDFGLDKS